MRAGDRGHAMKQATPEQIVSFLTGVKAVSFVSDMQQENARLMTEIERLKEEVTTLRELRKFDRIEIERMRILLDRKLEG